VEPGELDPENVDTPGVFVQRVVALTPEQAADKRIEKRTTRGAPPAGTPPTGAKSGAGVEV
jgi:3-oxoacid CoA-transferase subunit A